MPDNSIELFRRRDFLRISGICAGCGLLPFSPARVYPPGFKVDEASGGEVKPDSYKEAEFYKKQSDKEIECELCPRKCVVGDKERGYCGSRENIDGSYYTLVYGIPCSANVDPIEKKPFFHFHPGSAAFSIATAGCNLNCKFCQNWQISQFRPEQIRNMDMSPSEVAERAIAYQCRSIAYTYSEPVIFYEYMRDTAMAGAEKDVYSVMISAGYIQPEPLQKLLPYLQAVKIDLKSFRDEYYRDICHGRLQPVLDSLKVLKESGIWFEIVYLMVPTLNDGRPEIEDLCAWIAGELGPDVPVHFTRFYPNYLLKELPPTPIKNLEAARDIARNAGLKFPYVGNVFGHEGENTYCPACGRILIERTGFQIEMKSLVDGACAACGQAIPGRWS